MFSRLLFMSAVNSCVPAAGFPLHFVISVLPFRFIPYVITHSMDSKVLVSVRRVLMTDPSGPSDSS